MYNIIPWIDLEIIIITLKIVIDFKQIDVYSF